MTARLTSSRQRGLLVLTLGIVMLLLGLRLALGERPVEMHGPRALLDALFTGALALCVGWIGLGAGHATLHALRVADSVSSLERWVFALPLGLGVIAYGVLALGLISSLYPWALAAWLVAVAVLARRWLKAVLLEAWDFGRDLPHLWRQLSPGMRGLTVLAGTLLALAALHVLSPPWDADSLLYHLSGPKWFLHVARIQYSPDNWLISYPFTVQMLFTLGLGFGSDSFARVINLTFAVVLCLMTVALARRYLGRTHAAVSLAVLISTPIAPIWATLAYVDMAWAVYTLMGVFAVMLWRDERRLRWLIAAGLALGFAAGTKYFALGTAGIIGLWIIWNDLKRGVKRLLSDATAYGLTVVLIASPWYLKNWIWTGSPLYPIAFAGNDAVAQQARIWSTYMLDFGTGRALLDYLLLPLNLYARYYRFGTFLGSIEIPSPLYLVLALYPFTPRPRALNGLIGVAFLSFALWALGAQQTRFLLPIFPLLSILVSVVLVDGIGWQQRRWRTISIGLMAGMLAVSLFYSVTFFLSVEPYKAVAGVLSKDEFLERATDNYAALRFIRTNLPREARVLMLWDGRGYYCDERCLPDIDHARWTYLVMTHPNALDVADELRREGVTHVLTSVESLDFILQHDRAGDQRRAADFFAREFRPACLREIFAAHGATLYELACP